MMGDQGYIRELKFSVLGLAASPGLGDLECRSEMSRELLFISQSEHLLRKNHEI
jgi:hypothetical protein